MLNLIGWLRDPAFNTEKEFVQRDHGDFTCASVLALKQSWPYVGCDKIWSFKGVWDWTWGKRATETKKEGIQKRALKRNPKFVIVLWVQSDSNLGYFFESREKRGTGQKSDRIIFTSKYCL